jgi:hypothetical protein
MSELTNFYDNLMGAVSASDGDRVRDLIDPSFVMYSDPTMPYGGLYPRRRGVPGHARRRL